jgi:hypothetical protein
MKELIKHLVILTIISGATVAVMQCCTTSRSPLIDDDRIPMLCKIELDCMYYHQESEGKASCVVIHGTSCNKALHYLFCNEVTKDIENKSLKDSESKICMARLQ